MSIHMYTCLWQVVAVVVRKGIAQGCLSLFLISFDMLLLFYSRPFVDDWKDMLTCGYRLVAFSIVIIGLLLHCSKQDSSNTRPNTACISKEMLWSLPPKWINDELPTLLRANTFAVA